MSVEGSVHPLVSLRGCRPGLCSAVAGFVRLLVYKAHSKKTRMSLSPRLCPPGAAPVTSYACRKFRIQDQILDFGNSEAESCREGEAGASLFSVFPPGL